MGELRKEDIELTVEVLVGPCQRKPLGQEFQAQVMSMIAKAPRSIMPNLNFQIFDFLNVASCFGEKTLKK